MNADDSGRTGGGERPGGPAHAPGPATPAPSTPGPAIPGPADPAPSTPGPVIPAPDAQAPNIPDPAAPARNTPGPAIPAPNTPARVRPGQGDVHDPDPGDPGRPVSAPDTAAPRDGAARDADVPAATDDQAADDQEDTGEDDGEDDGSDDAFYVGDADDEAFGRDDPQADPGDPDPESDGPDLEAIGMELTAPPAQPGDVARERLEAAGGTSRFGRLAELVVWWAQVRGDAWAGPAGDVVRVVPGVGRAPVPRLPGPVRTLALEPPDDPAEAIAWGVSTADSLADSGVELILLSAPDPVPARVLAALLLGLDAVEANGWPTAYGVDDESWMQQVAAIRDGLRTVKGLRGRPNALLRALASPVLAAATGLLLQSALRRTPVLLDGPGASAAALLAQRTSPYGRDWWQVGHLSEHPLHERCLSSLRLQALTRLGMTSEDGTGALLGLAVLDLATGLLEGTG